MFKSNVMESISVKARLQAANPWRSLYLVFAVMASMTVSAQAQSEEPTGSERWESDIQSFESTDRSNPPPSNGIVFAGSSSIRMWNSLPETLKGFPVIKRGFGGSELSDAIAFAHRIILPYKPSIVYVYEGDNDISKGKTPERVLADFKKLTGMIHKELPDCRIGFIAIKPSISRRHLMEKMNQANQLIRTYCQSNPRLEFIDIYTPMLTEDGEPDPTLFVSDGLHLNAKGYEVWMKVIHESLNRSSWLPDSTQNRP